MAARARLPAALLRYPGRQTFALTLIFLSGLLLSAKVVSDAWTAAVSALHAEAGSLLLILKHRDIPGLRREIETRLAHQPGTLIVGLVHHADSKHAFGSFVEADDLARIGVLPPGSVHLLFLSRGVALVHVADVAAGVRVEEADIRDVSLYHGRWLPTSAETAVFWSLVLGWTAIGGVTLVLTWLRLRYQRGLEAINIHVQKVGDGHLDRLSDDGRSAPEIQILSKHLNQMIDGLRIRVATLRSLAEISAHELRTQLTRMQLSLSRLARTATDAGAQNEIRTLRQDLHDLISLYDGLISLARTSADLHDVSRFREFDLAALLRDVADDHADVLAAGGRQLTVSVDGPAPVLGDLQLVQRLFENLFDNARKYTPPGAAITLMLERSDRSFRILLANTGGAFPADIRTRAFEPGERSHCVDGIPGLGLGLSLVRAIAAKHGWNVAILPSDEIAAIQVQGSLWRSQSVADAAQEATADAVPDLSRRAKAKGGGNGKEIAVHDRR